MSRADRSNIDVTSIEPTRIESPISCSTDALQAVIERFADLIERCRKAMLFSMLAVGAGAIWVLRDQV